MTEAESELFSEDNILAAAKFCCPKGSKLHPLQIALTMGVEHAELDRAVVIIGRRIRVMRERGDWPYADAGFRRKPAPIGEPAPANEPFWTLKPEVLDVRIRLAHQMARERCGEIDWDEYDRIAAALAPS